MPHDRPSVPYEFSALQRLQHADAGQLATLLQLDAAEVAWDTADLTVLWRQQLASRLVTEIAPDDPEQAALLDVWGRSVSPAIVSFGHLLHHPTAPMALLDMVRPPRQEAHRQSGLSRSKVHRASLVLLRGCHRPLCAGTPIRPP